jgi:hypothetical protein
MATYDIVQLLKKYTCTLTQRALLECIVVLPEHTEQDIRFVKKIFYKVMFEMPDEPIVELYKKYFDDNILDYAPEVKLDDKERERLIGLYKKKQEKPDTWTSKYAKGEVVGAQDKEGRWWMSEVLEVFMYKGHCMYYVKFFGWGDQFNEFITAPYKIRRYNPLKHKYFRAPASVHDPCLSE